MIFVTDLFFYGKGLLAPRRASNLEDHRLSFVRGCLFIIFTANLHSFSPFLHPQPEDAPCLVTGIPSSTVSLEFLNIILLMCIIRAVFHLGFSVLTKPDSYYLRPRMFSVQQTPATCDSFRGYT
jgi:hypothetical protein